MESRLRELELLQRGRQESPIQPSTIPALDADDIEDLALVHLYGTADHEEGVRAILEKREPQFKGR